ncbi:MAG: response regulator [Lentisphaeraceae bacterium]|nr:response regulator [Lentisphaeraceae bacterium]
MNCLIVDDAPACRTLLKKILQRAGHETIECQSGEECLEILNKEMPQLDVIFLDIHLGGINGIEVTRRIGEMKAYQNTPIVICSADGKRGTILQALKSGAFTYVLKPCTKTDVLEALNEINESSS